MDNPEILFFKNT